MKARVLFILMLICICSFSFAQHRVTEFGDAEVARQYLEYILQGIKNKNVDTSVDVFAALRRATEFANVSSDISYLYSVFCMELSMQRFMIIEWLDKALEVNIWTHYSPVDALLLKAENLIALRRYNDALSILEQINDDTLVSRGLAPENQIRAAELQLLAFRGLAYTGDAYALAQFRSNMLLSMDRFPREGRFLKIFFEYAKSKKPDISDLPDGDLELMELALRRLPFLLEENQELAWMATPFIRDLDDARRLLEGYWSGNIPKIQNKDFIPHPASIPLALNLGLIDDISATNNLFSGTGGLYYFVPAAINITDPVLEKNIIIDTYNLLRSEEGRELFTEKLHSFTGLIISDDDNDGIFESRAFYKSGRIHYFMYDRDQSNDYNFNMNFSADGTPHYSNPNTGPLTLAVFWERYPSVSRVNREGEEFFFRPADFQYAPIKFITLGGSRRLAGLSYPVILEHIELSRRTLVSSCSSFKRSSVEIDGAVEEIFFDRNGIPRQAVEKMFLSGQQVSITEFESGLPVIQYIDLDLDGRMETVRRFRTPDPSDPWFSNQMYNYRALISSSESDFIGDGQFKTGEVYLLDGSVVYTFDMDGSGTMNYSETDSGN